MQFVEGEESLHITVSVGVAAYPEVEINDEMELIRLADKALYTAKGSGRNRVVIT
jgi:two-component system cell cycle response regulator